MDNKVITIDNDPIQSRIFTFRDKQVMLDRDMAELYGSSPELVG